MEKLEKAIQDFQLIKDYYKNLHNLEYHEKSENIYFPFEHVYITNRIKKPRIYMKKLGFWSLKGCIRV